MMTFLQVMYRQDKATAVCLYKCTSGYYLGKENAYLGDKHESIWKIANCSDVELHVENAHFNLETNIECIKLCICI